MARSRRVEPVRHAGSELGGERERPPPRKQSKDAGNGLAGRPHPSVALDHVPGVEPALDGYRMQEPVTVRGSDRLEPQDLVAIPRAQPVGEPAAGPAVGVVEHGHSIHRPEGTACRRERSSWEDGVMAGIDDATRDVPRASVSPRPTGAAPLVAADALALFAFVAIGLRSHQLGPIAEVAARNTLPLAGTWIVVALAVGTYRRRDLSSLAITWAIAIPVALLGRTWWVGAPRGDRIVVFLIVGVAFTGLFLALGRCVAWAGTRSRPVWRRGA